MTPRGETGDADSHGIDAPLPGFVPYQADGPLGILERAARRLSFRLIGPTRHSVLEDDASHAQRIQPGSDLLAFQLPVEVPVTSPWADQNRGSGVLALLRPIDSDGRLADVGHH